MKEEKDIRWIGGCENIIEEDIPIVTRIVYKMFYYFTAGMMTAGAILFALHGKAFLPLLIAGCVMFLPQVVVQIWYSKRREV